MKTKHLVFLILPFIFFGCKSPESLTNQYSELMANGDCESLIILSTAQAQKTLINYNCKTYESIIIKEIYCETGKTSATCNYSEQKSLLSLNKEVETTLKLVKLNGDWKIANIDATVIGISGGTDPKEVTDIFIKLMSSGDLEHAKLLTIHHASSKVENINFEEFEPFNTEITSIKCDIKSTTAKCYITEKRNHRNEIKYVYTLVKSGDEWRISNFSRDIKGSPQGATLAFVQYLSEGNCNDALELATGNAKETIIGTIEAGCSGYESEVVGGVSCDVEGNTATCSCTEKRDILGEMTFKYDLIKVDGDWKVSNYEKDMGDFNDEKE